MALFAIGFTMLVFSRNIMKKILGLNIVDTGVYLFLASMGYIEGNLTPIVPSTGDVNALEYINPIPQGLVLTGIVVSVSFSALMLALTVRLYKKYRTLNLDKIYEMCRKEDELE
ncbi:MAG: cation:proton antiporter subunit C [Clostridia bacterium]|nr:cation:proton antiporter subunit C [Clostridia bacterium]